LATGIINGKDAQMPKTEERVSNYLLVQKNSLQANSVALVTNLEWYLLLETSKYEISYKKAWATIQCESGWKETARGDNGLAYSILQFHLATFNAYKHQYGWPELDYYNPYDQIKLAVRMWAEDKGYNWTCWKRLKTFADKI